VQRLPPSGVSVARFALLARLKTRKNKSDSVLAHIHEILRRNNQSIFRFVPKSLHFKG